VIIDRLETEIDTAHRLRQDDRWVPPRKCNDGAYPYAAHHQGACSHHGGVAVFYQ
jgi:hypothetical protein